MQETKTAKKIIREINLYTLYISNKLPNLNLNQTLFIQSNSKNSKE